MTMTNDLLHNHYPWGVVLHNIFYYLHVITHKIQTRLIHNSCAFWSLTFGCKLIESYTSFIYHLIITIMAMYTFIWYNRII